MSARKSLRNICLSLPFVFAGAANANNDQQEERVDLYYSAIHASEKLHEVCVEGEVHPVWYTEMVRHGIEATSQFFDLHQIRDNVVVTGSPVDGKCQHLGF